MSQKVKGRNESEYKETIVKALVLEKDLRSFAQVHCSDLEPVVQLYIEAVKISVSGNLSESHTKKAIFSAIELVSNFSDRLAEADRFDAISHTILSKFWGDTYKEVGEKYYSLCIKLAEYYESHGSSYNAASAYKEASRFGIKNNLDWDKINNPATKAYDLLFNERAYLQAAQWAKEIWPDGIKAKKTALDAYNVSLNSKYIAGMESGLDVVEQFGLGDEKKREIGNKICKSLKQEIVQYEDKDKLLAAFHYSQIAYYAKKAGLAEIAKESAIKACELKFAGAEEHKDIYVKMASYDVIIDTVAKYGLEKEIAAKATEKLNKLGVELDLKNKESSRLKAMNDEHLFEVWFETKRA